MSTTSHRLPLAHVRVHDAMHPGIITVDPETSLRGVARLMAEHRVHAIAVADRNGRRPWGIVSGLDVARAVASGLEPTAGEVAATEVVTVSAGAGIDHAAQLMSEHEVGHLVVLDRASGYPIGILSVLDIASAYGA